MTHTIVPIVEGHGEVVAAPLLIRRIAEAMDVFDVVVKKPIRVPKHKLQKPGELERTLDLAIQKAEGICGIIILLDADDDCPGETAPALLTRAKKAHPGVPIQLVLAKMEYEAWFLGAIGSLTAEKGGELKLVCDYNPEIIRGAKERLEQLLDSHYSETVDQPAYTALFDLGEARANCPSFDKCWRCLENLFAD
jgi:hypothetical protein